jgi:hypothetical protein
MTSANWERTREERRARLEQRTHHVYRVWDDLGLLLYIGCTVDLGKRMTQHRKNSAWWPHLDDMRLDAYHTRSDALAAEFLAIESEGSYFNFTRDDIYRIQARRVAGQQYPERTAAELDAKYPSLTHGGQLVRYLNARAAATVSGAA